MYYSLLALHCVLHPAVAGMLQAQMPWNVLYLLKKWGDSFAAAYPHSSWPFWNICARTVIFEHFYSFSSKVPAFINNNAHLLLIVCYKLGSPFCLDKCLFHVLCWWMKFVSSAKKSVLTVGVKNEEARRKKEREVGREVEREKERGRKVEREREREKEAWREV